MRQLILQQARLGQVRHVNELTCAQFGGCHLQAASGAGRDFVAVVILRAKGLGHHLKPAFPLKLRAV